ncbi:hypothetical protein [Bacteroides acidifaciens]|uniref:hypothetical protein n=1 Tax=Bacteroides acidifaciens TaxID=85831 RepID=UPI00301451EE
MKPGNSKPHVVRMMKTDYCMVSFHIRACLIPQTALFRGCLKKSDTLACGTEKERRESKSGIEKMIVLT